jgi:phosphatidylglycerophosphatase A
MPSLRRLLLTGLGTGYLPLAPGSWGSAAVCGIYLALAFACTPEPLCLHAALLAIVAAASLVCVRFGPSLEQAFGKTDPRQCTADEWAGQAVTLLLLPAGATWTRRLVVAGTAFVLFRLFDVVKPPPARRLERLPCGWGVLLDDLVAAVYANLAAQLLLRLWLLRLLGA